MLYDATVSPFLRMLAALDALLDKAAAHCAREGIAPEELITARLAPDMEAFAYQIKSTAIHSAGAIEGIKRGTFTPDRSAPGETFDALKARLAATRAALDALAPAEVEDLADRPMKFEVGRHFAPYTGSSFLLHFSKPNFYFHATTAYDILRHMGLDIGKIDYLGKLDLRKA